MIKIPQKIISNIYLDNAATAPICNVAKSAVNAYIDEYGNPSSLHKMGKDASKLIAESRRVIAKYLSASEREIFFTSGGSESNTWAVMGLAELFGKQGKKHIISSTIEHHSVLGSLDSLKKMGFEITLIAPEENGIINPDNIKEAIRDDTAFVSIMWVNNEIGTIQRVKDIGCICREHNVPFHVDAVQAVGHIPVDIKSVDLLSASGHKFGGLKGTGFLYCSRSIKLPPLIYGGSQNYGKRAGTENMLGIISMSAALKDSCSHLFLDSSRIYVMRERLLDRLLKIPDARLNGNREVRVPGNINISFKDVMGESLALLLSSKGIYVSTTSACSSTFKKESHVLQAINAPPEYINGTIRITIGRENTIDDIDAAATQIEDIIIQLRKLKEV